MTKQERGLTIGEPQETRLSRWKRSVLEKIPGTRTSVEKLLAECERELEKCIQESLLPDLGRKGLLGVHELEALPVAQRGTYGEVQGEVHGGFLLFFGSLDGRVEGETRTVSSIQFAWRTNNEARNLIISEIPVDEFVLEVNDELERPTAEFEFDLRRLIDRKFNTWWAKRFPHANEYLRPKFLRQVILTLNPETLEFLPLPLPAKKLIAMGDEEKVAG